MHAVKQDRYRVSHFAADMLDSSAEISRDQRAMHFQQLNIASLRPVTSDKFLSVEPDKSEKLKPWPDLTSCPI